MTFFNQLLAPFQLNFMLNAFVIVTLLAIPMALLSCFLVLKSWSLMGDAISHAVFPGIVIAYILGIPYIIGAFFSGLICALLSGYIAENSRIKQDTVMGIVFSGMFALGLVLYVKIQSDVHLDHILFGDMLGISIDDLILSCVITLIVIGFVGVKWKDYVLFVFDPIQVTTVGLSLRFLHYSLLCLISLAIVSALQAVGLILSIALLIAPGAIAYLLTNSFKKMLIFSIGIALFASLSGVYLSFFIDSAPAPTIVLIFSIFFLLVFLFVSWKTRRIENQVAD